MTRQESAIISLRTGVLCGPFEAMHEYCEKLLGREVFTHELANKELVDELQKLCQPDFQALCDSVSD